MRHAERVQQPHQDLGFVEVWDGLDRQKVGSRRGEGFSRGAWKLRRVAAETPYLPRYSEPSANVAP